MGMRGQSVSPPIPVPSTSMQQETTSSQDDGQEVTLDFLSECLSIFIIFRKAFTGPYALTIALKKSESNFSFCFSRRRHGVAGRLGQCWTGFITSVKMSDDWWLTNTCEKLSNMQKEEYLIQRQFRNFLYLLWVLITTYFLFCCFRNKFLQNRRDQHWLVEADLPAVTVFLCHGFVFTLRIFI